MADVPQVTEEWAGKRSERQSIERRWWTLDSERVHEHLIPFVKQLEQRQSYRRVRNIRHARLYSNLEALGFQSSLYSRQTQDILAQPRVTLNVVKSCIDTAASKIAKVKPRPLFLTRDGDWSQQQRAKLLTAYFEGLFQEGMPIYPEKQRSFVDSGVFGTGATKFFKGPDGKPTCERTLIDEVIVDDSEAIYGAPPTFYQTRYVPRDALLSDYGDSEEEIVAAKGSHPEMPQTPGASEMVKVVEAWRLASGKGKKDGRHVICIEGVDLLDEKWGKTYAPFVFDRWNSNLTGFFGMGIAEELTGIQLEINKLCRQIQLAQHFMCVPRVFVENASQVNAGHLNTTVGGILKYAGTPPVFNTAPAMPAEVYQHLQYLERKAYEITGISMLSAQSQKPAGLNSGKALREFQDIESDRFQLVGQRWEQSFLDVTGIVMDLLEESSVKVGAKVGKDMRELDWKDVRMDQGDFVLRVFPASILPSQPAGKLATVQELTQAGFIEKDMALSLLDFPDLEAAMSLKTAAIDVVKKQVHQILDEGEAVTPEPFQDLALAEQMAQWAYLRAYSDGAPEDRLELLRVFMSDCKALQEQAKLQAQEAAMAAQGGMPGLSPQAVPSAPPVSDLLPNAPEAAMAGAML